MNPDILQREYGLTPTEAYITGRLCGGFTTSDIAKERGIRVGTVRVHLRAVFRKFKMHNQAQVVRYVLFSEILRLNKELSELKSRAQDAIVASTLLV